MVYEWKKECRNSEVLCKHEDFGANILFGQCSNAEIIKNFTWHSGLKYLGNSIS